MSLKIEDLSPAMRKRLGVKVRRKSAFDKESVRRHAIRCLATIVELSQQQRRRVLDHALKVNKA